MRLLLGALILLSIFAAAALWQRSWTTAARADRVWIRPSADESVRGKTTDGWGNVVVGRPSGGEPYASPRQNAEATPPSQVEPRLEPSPPPPAEQSVTGVEVRSGQTLSGICREHYGSAKRDLVDALARFNRVANPDDLREGQRILLPPAEKLLRDP